MEKKINKKLQKPVETKKLNPADYVDKNIRMPGSGIEKKIAENHQKKSGKNPEGGLNEKIVSLTNVRTQVLISKFLQRKR